ncbi:MAG: TetR/AcrR family transcriptional regulator [Deltaproteobacteria bacterium]|nr:TetR/AcrR family transcriptional regulator [Deltaproteobacteria bacterium]
MKRKRMTGDARKISIIEATINIVSRLNYDSATVALIAEEAGINQALIYNHYKSKQELQLAMLDYIYETILERYKTGPLHENSSGDTTSIRAFAALYHSNREEEGRYRSCVVKAMVAIDPMIREKAWEIMQEEHAFIREGYAADKNRGAYEKDFDIDTAAWWVLACDLLFSTMYIMGKTETISRDSVLASLKYIEDRLKGQKKPRNT